MAANMDLTTNGTGLKFEQQDIKAKRRAEHDSKIEEQRENKRRRKAENILKQQQVQEAAAEKRRLRQEKHEQNMRGIANKHAEKSAADQQKKAANVAKQMLIQKKAKQEQAERESREVEISTDMEAFQEALAKQLTRKFGAVERVRVLPFAKKVCVTFKDAKSATNCVNGGEFRQPMSCAVSQKLISANSLFFGLPSAVEPVKWAADSEEEEQFLLSVRRHFAQHFGPVKRLLKQKSCAVVEFLETSVQESILEANEEQLTVQGVCVGPVYAGVPKVAYPKLVEKQAKIQEYDAKIQAEKEARRAAKYQKHLDDIAAAKAAATAAKEARKAQAANGPVAGSEGDGSDYGAGAYSGYGVGGPAGGYGPSADYAYGRYSWRGPQSGHGYYPPPTHGHGDPYGYYGYGRPPTGPGRKEKQRA
eukprot:34175_1